MKYKFKVPIEDWYDVRDGKSFSMGFNPGFTCIVGPNGTGKSTSMIQIGNYCENNSIPFYAFDYTRITKMHELKGPGMLVRSLTSSEGENIPIWIESVIRTIGSKVREAEAFGKPCVILFDAVDSGASIDMIRYMKNDIFDMILQLEIKKGNEVYIIVSSNTFEMARNADCVIAFNGKHKTFKTYSAFEKFILSNSKIEDTSLELKEIGNYGNEQE